MNLNATLNSTYKLTENEIDTYVSNIRNVNLTINTNDSIIIAQPVNQGGNVTILGASFTRGIGGQIVNGANTNDIINSNLSAAAIISNQSLTGATSLNMLIIDKPTIYKNIENSTDKTLASSVIVTTVQTNDSVLTQTNISLYFRVLNEYRPNRVAQYFCSFYNTITLKWNESGCTRPQYNPTFDRYECTCNHLSTFALLWAPYAIPCGNATHMSVSNGSCISRTEVQIETVNTLRNTTNSSVIAESLSLYISSVTNLNATSNSSYILTVDEIDTFVSRINDTSVTINTNDLILVAKQPNQGDNITVLGVSFTRGTGGEVVYTVNKDFVINSPLSTAAIISNQSLTGITSLNMLIIDKPTTYEDIDISTNKKLASSVIVVGAQRNDSRLLPMYISLYFQVLNEYKPDVSADYLCSFYNTITLKWNEFGCTKPQYNPTFDRYECTCNHLSTFALLWAPYVIPCGNATHMSVSNGSCISRTEVQIETVNTLRNTTNSSVIAENLSLYISSVMNLNATSNSSYILTVDEIDTFVSRINDTNITINNNDSILVAKQPNQGDNIIVLGASFTRGIGGEVVHNENKDEVINSNLSTAAIISQQSLTGVISLNMLIIDKPTTYENIDISTNKKLASSVIIVAVQRNDSRLPPTNISLYFRVLNEYKPNTRADYFCSFYDTTTSKWNESGCTRPEYKPTFDRYECSCNHTTSFALIWLPKVPLTRHLNAQDIALLIVLSIVILCFIAIIIHGLTIRICISSVSTQARHLLPLISCAVTIILFIFYIALSMTVYTKTAYDDEKQCFTSSSVLMFFVYFFLIFMFCVKTSVGYFNYLRFVHLSSQPSYRQLYIMLVISFFISITWMAFAAGFNSNLSFHITQLYPHKICWFTRPAIYYFMTIPVCLFLLINIIIFIFVAYHILNHVQNAASSDQSYTRMKQCVIVLLLSCATQGIGWLLGPFLTSVGEEAGNVLGWFFIIFNGLEGLWCIVLYIIILSKHIDERKRVITAKEVKKPTESIYHKYEDYYEKNNEKEDDSMTKETI
ncbi:unnamed protein product [Rotaria sp. Silwood1]|nr:unnamed protein product [Rotaria sp. Silwood1]